LRSDFPLALPLVHDEARFLVQLDKKYRDKGLAIVALDFEEPEEQDKLTRERAFVKEYGVKYTYLIAGAPSEMWEKVPQAVNLNTWPATIFGRDGLVKGIPPALRLKPAVNSIPNSKRSSPRRLNSFLHRKLAKISLLLLLRLSLGNERHTNYRRSGLTCQSSALAGKHSRERAWNRLSLRMNH
jgi:hypothetical protein